MKKLIKGIMEFRRSKRESVRELFATLALGQKPDCFFIACSDSRVAANVFASTEPGDMFVVRNMGNIMPPAPDTGSAVAALEYAVDVLKVRHIVVCGHSDCGAITTLARDPEVLQRKHPLGSWLRHAQAAAEGTSDLDTISRRNVSVQLDNLRSHAMVREREAAGTLKLHGIWFNIRDTEVYYMEKAPSEFVLIDDTEGANILKRIGD
jgi:carbonic anhydrase